MIAVVVTVILMQVAVLHSNHHGHDHDIETPHFKYTREANEKQSVYDNHDNLDDHHHHHHHHEHPGHSHAHNEYHIHEKDHHHEHLSGESGHHHHRQQYIKSSQRNYQPYDPNGILSFMNDFHTRLWVYSIGSTLLISLMPFVLLSLIPLKANNAENEPLLKILLSFGSGGLLGDAFLHLIPHAQPHLHDDHSHSHAHSDPGHSHGPHDMAVGSYVLAGILAFLTVEKLVRIIRSESIYSHSHSHSHGNNLLSADNNKIKKCDRRTRARKEKSDASSAEESLVSSSDDEHKHLVEKTTNDETGFKVAAYLNMAADFAHNFTDGLAIGASFLAGTTIGIVTMITVLVHEIPHEIGDFAILIQSGFSKKKAMSVQLLTAFGALSGCIISLCSVNATELSDAASSNWILPFTAGGFIYIATVTVIPELLKNTSTWQSIKEIIALLTGIALMYLIAIYE